MSQGIIKFGTWNNKPIEWYILKEEGFGILITTKNSIGQYAFDNSNNSEWSSSSIRAFLNNDFWNKAFNDSEKRKVVNVYLNDVGSKDNVFLLSKNESNNFLSGFEFSVRGFCWTRTPYSRIYVNDNSDDRILYWCSSEWGKIEASNSLGTCPSLYLRKGIKI